MKHLATLLSFVIFGAIFIFGTPRLLAQGLDGCSDNNPATRCGVVDDACFGVSDSTLCGSNTEQRIEDNSIFGQNGIFTKAARLISIVIGVAAVIMIIVGGIQYIISAGDPTNVSNAKNTILYAIIGLLVALLARAIISFVLVRL